MAYQVLARKWRPRRFEEVVGQEHITRTLQNAIKQNKLAHAYLFTGTRGVGKTSIARLFSKAIRCENRGADLNPCSKCPSCLDVDSGSSMDFREIDGASNNSVDDVRSLIDNVQYLPTRGQYKIYVIDEVHMLSVSAFNALLKTLEEPPAHAIFILATTDPQKLLGTVISRCQRYDFKNVPVQILQHHLQHIAKVEGIKFSSDLVSRRLAELGKGSIRDALSIFDQVLGLSESAIITEELLDRALGLAGSAAMSSILTSLFKSDVKTCTEVFNKLLQENIDLKKLCDQILNNLYNVINLIDNQKALYRDKVLEEGALNTITIAELFWIYETLAKDFGWALSSISPEKVVLIQLQKICFRRTILSGDDKKVTEYEQTQREAQPEIHKSQTKPTEPQKLKSWNDFLTHLTQVAPTTAANLSHGNLVDPLNFDVQPFSITVGFLEDSAVFQEYLEDKDVYARLKGQLSEFFDVPVEKIIFKTKILSLEEKKDKNFRTKVEIDDEAKLNEREKKKQAILNDPFILEAEKIFNSRVDKIILND